jgi:hypothetical protein
MLKTVNKAACEQVPRAFGHGCCPAGARLTPIWLKILKKSNGMNL